MQRDLAKFSDTVFDLLVVGGGVTGACIARDAAMRGLRVGLLEKSDFCSATSAASSKLLHGGLRYLRNFEFSLVRQSLRERQIWATVAPHQVEALPFLIPAYRRKGSPGRATLRAGLTLYDLLGFDPSAASNPSTRLPRHRALSANEALQLVPGLDPRGLTGAVVYYDRQMRTPERLALEFVIDADDRGAAVANYVEVEHLRVEQQRIRGVTARDTLTGQRVEVGAKVVVNATGPWADRLVEEVAVGKRSRSIVRSKGIHLVTRALTGDHAVAIESDGSHFFILPWRGHALIGTTDTLYEGDPDAFGVTEQDVEQFVATVNRGLPSARLRRDDVLYFYGGLRPLVETPELASSYGASRKAEIVDHDDQGLDGLFSTLGGKWTTSRSLAQEVVDKVAAKLGRALPKCATARVPLPGGATGPFHEFVRRACRQHPDFAPHTVEHLAETYGSRLGEVIELARRQPALKHPVWPGRPEIAAQIHHAIHQEMAMGLVDVFLRRTGLGTMGRPSQASVLAVADAMTEARGWDEPRRREQVDALHAVYATVGDGP